MKIKDVLFVLAVFGLLGLSACTNKNGGLRLVDQPGLRETPYAGPEPLNGRRPTLPTTGEEEGKKPGFVIIITSVPGDK
jgi:hypothetical protein